MNEKQYTDEELNKALSDVPFLLQFNEQGDAILSTMKVFEDGSATDLAIRNWISRFREDDPVAQR